MKRFFQLAFLVAPFAALAVEQEIGFNRDVVPILADTCFKCHGPDRAARKADLRVDSLAGATQVLHGAATIVPGHPEQSAMIARIFSDDPKKIMPPPSHPRKLTEQEKQIFKTWIAQGAKYEPHWAFIAPKRPDVPQFSNSKFQISNPIDAFVLAKLADEKIAPSPEAEKTTLIRRVTFDLTGLPPTLEEVDSFVADASSNAFEKVVNRLLKSPAYGERWCWDWLDAARYADSNGFQGDPDRTMWPWRDWVTKQLNANMPYDQFIVEQIAGDLISNATPDQVMASGFNRNHMHNGEGGRIAEETRVENVFDRTETVGTVFLGLTIGKMITYVQSVSLKVIIAVICGFANFPITREP